jgi:hypothetical protein
MWVAVSLALAGCDDHRDVVPTGPTVSGDIVVESTVLEQQFDGSGIRTGCDVLGRLRNTGTRDLLVTVDFRGFDDHSRAFASGDTGRVPVPPRGQTNFRAPLIFVVDCDDVERIEVSDIRIEPA